MLYGVLISVVHAECVAHSINQASFKAAGLVTGDPITTEKSHSRHSHSMSPSLMHCGNLLTIQFQTQTPTVYTVPQLLPSPHHFTFIRPHTSIKGKTGGRCSSISCQKLASKERESGGVSTGWMDRERERASVMRGNPKPPKLLHFWGTLSRAVKLKMISLCVDAWVRGHAGVWEYMCPVCTSTHTSVSSQIDKTNTVNATLHRQTTALTSVNTACVELQKSLENHNFNEWISEATWGKKAINWTAGSPGKKNRSQKLWQCNRKLVKMSCNRSHNNKSTGSFTLWATLNIYLPACLQMKDSRIYILPTITVDIF